jgi:hypothetical protein
MDGSIRHNDMMVLPRHALGGVEMEKVQSSGRMHGQITNWSWGRREISLNCFFHPPKLVKTTAQQKERVANPLFKDAIDTVQAQPSISFA